MRYITVFAVFMLAVPLSFAVAADHHAMMNHDMKMPQDIYASAMMKMHEEMGKAQPTGDADIDFIQGMIPHHQGAVEMAKILLQHGKDPQTRKLAQDIIKSQQTEIAMMKSWLAAHQRH